MATPETKRPNTLEEALKELTIDPSHAVRARIGQLEIELRVVGGEAKGVNSLEASAGGWADLLDCEAFERDVYERRHRPRRAAGL